MIRVDLEASRDHQHAPGPSLWPVGFALGVVVTLVGLVVAPWVIYVGGAISLVFAALWSRDLMRGTGLADTPDLAPERREPKAAAVAHTDGGHDHMSRSVFLELSTVGVGGVIGGLVTLPVLGFMVGPAFLHQGVKSHDVGPLEDYPEGQFLIATFESNEKEGFVSRRTAFVRNNGVVRPKTGPNAGKPLPSFTIISNRCAHLGCPVAPNGNVPYEDAKHRKDVTLIPVTPAGFGCPCHGGQYDAEGNVTAGPPVRALDRYSYSIINGHLFIGKPYSVSTVEGTGANATINAATFAFPGEHIKGIESWLYPIQPPH